MIHALLWRADAAVPIPLEVLVRFHQGIGITPSFLDIVFIEIMRETIFIVLDGARRIDVSIGPRPIFRHTALLFHKPSLAEPCGGTIGPQTIVTDSLAC